MSEDDGFHEAMNDYSKRQRLQKVLSWVVGIAVFAVVDFSLDGLGVFSTVVAAVAGMIAFVVSMIVVGRFYVASAANRLDAIMGQTKKPWANNEAA